MRKTLTIIGIITIFILALPNASSAAVLEIRQGANGKIDVTQSNNLPTVAVFVLMPPYASNPTYYAEQTYEGIRKAFEKSGRLRALPMEQTQKIYRRYARNWFFEDINKWQEQDPSGYRKAILEDRQRSERERRKWTSSDDGYFNFVPSEKDLLAIGQKSNADYSMFVSMKVNRQDIKSGSLAVSMLTLGLVPTARMHQTALWDIVLIDNNTGQFILDEAVTDIQGTSGSGVTTDRVFTKLVKSFVEGLDFDKLALDGEEAKGNPFFQPKEKKASEQSGDETVIDGETSIATNATIPKDYSIAQGQLGTPNILMYNTNIATWNTQEIAYNKELDRIVIKGSFTNNTSNYIARVRNMEMNVILLDNNNNYIRVFTTKFVSHDIDIRPHGQANYTYIVKGIPYDARYSGNYHISYSAQYFVRRSGTTTAK